MPKLAEYRSYIEHETKDGDPARIQCIYERAIKDNCLDASLWRDYTDYLVLTLLLDSISSCFFMRYSFAFSYSHLTYCSFCHSFFILYTNIVGFLNFMVLFTTNFVLSLAED